MVSGYKILWTNNALDELKDTYEYLQIHFTEQELRKLSVEIDKTLKLISQNPSLFPLSDKSNGIRRAVVKNLIHCIIEKRKAVLKFFHFSPIDKTLVKEKYKNVLHLSVTGTT